MNMQRTVIFQSKDAKWLLEDSTTTFKYPSLNGILVVFQTVEAAFVGKILFSLVGVRFVCCSLHRLARLLASGRES